MAKDRRRGGRSLAAIGVLVLVAILVLNAALVLLYRDARRTQQAELARRLESVAAALAQSLDPVLVRRARGEGTGRDSLYLLPAYDSLRVQLDVVAEAADLANIRLFDPAAVAYLDLTAPWEPNAAEALDTAALLAALAGATAHSPLYHSGKEYLMTGYAPVQDPSGLTVAVLAVEADARYFGALRRLRFAMVASAALSGLVLAGLGFLFARMQASLARAEEAVRRAETLAAMGRMAAGIAHEIRNPLGIIRATAARLKKRYDDPAHPDEKFDYIGEEVDRLNAILTGYLHFARDEAPRLEPIELVAVLQRSLSLLAPELESAAITLEADLPAACSVRGDAPRLQQVFMNVILNSVQAMPTGGRLRVHLRRDAGAARLVFADTGPGMPAADRARAFEPFFTTKATGSGLGLAVAKRIIEQHGGRIGLDRAEPHGLRVDIELPAA